MVTPTVDKGFRLATFQHVPFARTIWGERRCIVVNVGQYRVQFRGKLNSNLFMLAVGGGAGVMSLRMKTARACCNRLQFARARLSRY